MSSGSNRVGVALGSNLGDRLRFLQFARDRLRDRHADSGAFRQSSVYETAPVGCESAAQDFYNAVIEIGTTASPEQFLNFLQEIERDLGRPEDHPRNTTRSIDLDLLYFGDRKIEGPGLSVPHPRLSEREFVLRPLAEIAPGLRLPHQRATVTDLLAALPKGNGVRRVYEKW